MEQAFEELLNVEVGFLGLAPGIIFLGIVLWVLCNAIGEEKEEKEENE